MNDEELRARERAAFKAGATQVLAWLTTRPEAVKLGSQEDCAVATEELFQFEACGALEYTFTKWRAEQ